MYTTLVMVMSVDGKITKWNSVGDVSTWTSTEDKAHFGSLISNCTAMIMGKNTYIAAKDMIKLSPKVLRLVMTKNPEKYRKLAVPGQLEFTNKSAKRIITYLEKQGNTQALLLGGSTVNATFFQAKLVNEIQLTIEPKLFGNGLPLIANEKLDIDLRLESIKKLNDTGTLLLKYKVL